jgi:multiple sugar transport system ATP-binding protein
MSALAPSARPRLQLVDVSKHYGDTLAVDRASFEVAAGETVALLGPSGCGKSTTLNMIVGLETPDSGDILIDGQSVKHLPAGRRPVGLVFQDYAVFTHMSVRANLAFGLKVRGDADVDIRRAVDETAEFLGLTDVLREKASRLGGSQLQRIAIGRTLVLKPAILLLDEPLSNLEVSMRNAMRQQLRRIQEETRQTVIYVTHDQIEALSLAHRIAVMHAGKVRQYDTTDTVYRRPASAFVGGFLGNPPMQFLSGDVQLDAGVRWLTGPSGRVPLSTAGHGAAAPVQSVTVGVRPEDILVVDARDGAGFDATVLQVEPQGAKNVLSVAASGWTLKVLVPGSHLPEAGTRLRLRFDPDELGFFDPVSGARLIASADWPLAA